MAKVAIVGGGQSGLQLALGLQQQGYDVTVVTDRRPEEVREGRVMSSQCMFDAALQTERDLGINVWEDECPNIEGIGLIVVGPEGTPVIDWDARLDAYAQSVDQRVKMPGWMEIFSKRGGNLDFDAAGVAELEKFAKENDLVVVASGKGEVSALFERDAERSMYDAPQRALALTYVNGYTERETYPAVTFNLIPTVGEYFWFPALTTTGACHIMVFEGVPGGPMDCWTDVKTASEHLEKTKWILETFLPWEAERAKRIKLTDDNGVLAGRFAPTVRKAVATLPSGARVLGMADVVVLNDPITGQGSNNAAKCADSYLKSILARESNFDAQWMQDTFERYWDYAQHVTLWTNMLLQPPPEHVVNLLGAAGQLAPIASKIVNGFDNPPDFFPWWADPAEAAALVEREAAAAGAAN